MSADLRTMEHVARAVGRRIAEGLPAGVGFTLLLYTFDPGWITYLSNAQRADMVRTLREMLARLERGEERPPFPPVDA